MSIMVWGGISGLVKTKLVIVLKGVKLNANIYHELILQGAVISWAQGNVENTDWWLQQDWAPAHGAKKTLEANLPGKEVWPLNSPDLNPMDFTVWGILEQKSVLFKAQIHRIAQTCFGEGLGGNHSRRHHGYFEEFPEASSSLYHSTRWTF